MSGLVLKLCPRERLLVNGAVIENGDRRSRLTIVTANAKVLRLRDAIHPCDADTPVKRACYLTQLLLSGDRDIDDIADHLKHEIATLCKAFLDEKSCSLLSQAQMHLSENNPYKCLKLLRQLLPIESKLLREVE